LNPRNAAPMHVTVTLSAIAHTGGIGQHCAGIRWLLRDATARLSAELQAELLRQEVARLEADQQAKLPTDIQSAMNLVVREKALREQAEHSSRMKDRFLALVV